jgi:mono/diheme cytochrome c family protein
MPVFLIKSLLSIPLFVLVLISTITMFEILGRTERKFAARKLRRLHAFAGFLYILLFALISYFCLETIARTGAELSPRSTIHSMLAVAIIVLLAIKSSFVRVYRRFYAQTKTIGLVISVLSLLMIASSAGFYLLVTWGQSVQSATRQGSFSGSTASKFVVRTDSDSIRQGKKLYYEKCIICHDPLSTNTVVGPGHKGILKNPFLPASNRPATPENIAIQLRHPIGEMPSFDYLSDDEILDLISYMKTL